MKTIRDILPSRHVTAVYGSDAVPVEGIALDSRQVQAGWLFAALEGTAVDGHAFIPAALAAGASAIICRHLPEQMPEGVCFIQTDESSKLLALVAGAFYGNPTHFLDLVGVTGTNGKTTTATLLYQLFTRLGYKCGLISTAGILIAGRPLETQHTTPDAVRLNQLLAEMVEEDVDYAFIEVSSHSVVQDRIYGLNFRGGIFTNLTHDHLDYHQTFENYRNAKKGFFDMLDSEAFALTNVDDKNGRFMLQNTRALRVTYGLQNPADFKGRIVELDLYGMQMLIDDQEIYTHLSGTFNAYNLLAVYATARLMDVPAEDLIRPLSSLQGVEGRFDKVTIGSLTGIVDYAHTPDALEKILQAIHEINVQGRKVITVIGCGGNRDRAKRPIMARIAADLSHQVVLTSDNPRNENPEDILDEMETGITASRRPDVLRITDRKQAIKTAVSLAGRSAIILVAGKGHEKYQEINGVRYAFDDKQVLTELMNEGGLR